MCGRTPRRLPRSSSLAPLSSYLAFLAGPPPPSGLPRRPGHGSVPRNRLPKLAVCRSLCPARPASPAAGQKARPARSPGAADKPCRAAAPAPARRHRSQGREPGAGAAAAPPARTPPRSRPRRAQRRGPPAPLGPAHCGARHWRRPAGGCSSGREPSGSHRGPSSVAAVLHAGLRREGAAPEGAQRGPGKRTLGAGPALLCRLTGEWRSLCLTPL